MPGPPGRPPGSALRVLRCLPRPLQSVLLALLHPRIAGQEPRLAKRQAVAVGIDLEQRAGNAVPDGAGLTGHAAALDLDHHVEPTLGPGHPERHADLGLVDRIAEVLLERATVDHDLTLARQQPDTG